MPVTTEQLERIGNYARQHVSLFVAASESLTIGDESRALEILRVLKDVCEESDTYIQVVIDAA